MKKRIVMGIMCAALAASSFSMVGCGAKAEAPAAEEAPAEEAVEEEAEEEAEGEPVSDETWAQLQDVYAALIEARDATNELYQDDAVAADDDITDALAQADDLIAEVGDIDRADVTEENAKELVDAMLAINDIFSAVIDNIEIVDDAEAEDAEEAEGEPVSDETWAQVQEVYAALVEARDATNELYQDDAVAADDSITDALAQADDLIAEVGDIDRADVTEENAKEIVEAMLSINEIFSTVIDNMKAAE